MYQVILEQKSKLLVLAWVTLFLVGCTTQVSIQGRYPAAIKAAADLNPITVFEFNGTEGKVFSKLLMSTLKGAVFDSKEYFSVISPEIIASKMAVRSKNKPLAENLSAALQYGRKLGVKGVYFGSIGTIDIKTSSHQQKRTQCVDKDCDQKREYQVTCYKQEAYLSAQPQLVNVNTAEVVYSEQVSAHKDNRYCQDSGSAKSKSLFTQELMSDIAQQVRYKVAPYNKTIKVDLINDSRGLNELSAMKFKSAVSFAQAGQMDRACALWQEISANSPESNQLVSLLYNLGVCAEAVADYDRAIELYARAESLLTSPNKKVTEARERAYQMKRNQAAI